MNLLLNCKKKKIFYLFLYITLVIGFLLNEDTIGGSKYDWQIISNVIESFTLDPIKTFKNYYDFSISHYPYYYIFVSQIYKISNSILLTKILILHLNLILPFIFFLIIKIKYNYKNNYLIYLPGIFFLSPSFRSTAIWTLNDNIALIFFSLSILFYFKSLIEKSKKKIIIYIILNVLMLAFASYIRQYYSIFSIYFFFQFLQKYNYKIITLYIITNLLLASFAIKSTFFSTNLNYSFNFFSPNLFNNLGLSITIFIIYLIPIISNKHFVSKTINYYCKKKKLLILSLLISLIISTFFDYKLAYGGGIIYKIFYGLNANLYFTILIFSLLFLLFFFSSDYKNNSVLFLCLLLCFPTSSIYQKYFDPLSLILIFTLFNSSFTKTYINNLNYNINYLYLYYLSIYIGNLVYNLLLR